MRAVTKRSRIGAPPESWVIVSEEAHDNRVPSGSRPPRGCTIYEDYSKNHESSRCGSSDLMKKRFFLVVVCLTLLPVVLSADTVVEEIVARVNNQIITRTEYQREREQLKQEAQQQDASNADKLFADREKDILRGLIDQQLMLEKAKDLGINADTDLIKRLDEIRKQMNLESMDDLEKA